MALSSQFSVQCPVCANDIAFYRVRRRFNCRTCATTLGSNRTSVDVWAALIYILLVPVLWVIASLELKMVSATSYAEWAGLTAVIGIAAYCILAPRLLVVETSTWSRDASAAPADGKRKVIDYRSGANGPHAGARKRTS